MINKDYQNPLDENQRENLRRYGMQLVKDNSYSFFVLSAPHHLELIFNSLTGYLESCNETISNVLAGLEPEKKNNLEGYYKVQKDVTYLLHMIHEMLEKNKITLPEAEFMKLRGISVACKVIPITEELLKEFEAAQKAKANDTPIIMFMKPNKGEA